MDDKKAYEKKDEKKAQVRIVNKFQLQNEIRVFVADSNGFGHQASSVGIMVRLVQLGFRGRITVVYDDGDKCKEPVIWKLSILLPEIVLGERKERMNEGFEKQFLELRETQESLRKELKIIDNELTGAQESAVPPLKERRLKAESEIEENEQQFKHLERLMEDNKSFYYDAPDPIKIENIPVSFKPLSAFGAQELGLGMTGGYDDYLDLRRCTKTLYFSELQPIQWKKQNSKNAIFCKDAANILLDELAVQDMFFNDLGFFMRNPLKVNVEFVDSNRFPNLTAVKSVLDLTKAGKVNLCPVYGLMGFRYAPESVLLNLLLGLNQACFLDGPTARKQVVVVIGQLPGRTWSEAVAAKLQQAPNAIALYCERLGKALKFCEGDQLAGVSKMCADLAEHEILVVSPGRVPPKVFNLIYASATLPFVFEGKATASLAVNLGKPFFYLKSTGEEILYPKFPNLPKQIDIRKAAQKISDMLLDVSKEIEIQQIGAFINSCADSRTNPFKYFNALGAFYHHQKNDKLLIALNVLRKKYPNDSKLAFLDDMLNGSNEDALD